MHITQHMGNGLIGQCMVMSSFVSQSQFSQFSHYAVINMFTCLLLKVIKVQNLLNDKAE